MRFVILSRNPSLYSTSRLTLAARARGHHVTIINPLELHTVVSSSAPAFLYDAGPLGKVDVVIPRIGTSINSYGLTVVRQFDLMGTAVLNPAVAMARCRDKLRSLQLLASKGVDVPTTVCARSPTAVASVLKLVGGCPVIVKLQQGSQGIGTMIAETPQAVTSLLETFWAMGQDIILQEYIRESKGRDVRAIVVGKHVVAAMRRTARKGEFRSNLHRGGVGVGIDLPPDYRKTAIKAAHLMGLEVAGVDMVETKTGPKVLEVNASPGLEGIEKASGVDVATAIVTYAERFATKWRGGSKQALARLMTYEQSERLQQKHRTGS